MTQNERQALSELVEELAVFMAVCGMNLEFSL
jgi:hypothetical protein